ncbi:MAG: hypothetical protein GC181_12230 [Bacteroidetes bacterium]|nr:hypothetical protein [Bacteroidota bacterium]
MKLRLLFILIFSVKSVLSGFAQTIEITPELGRAYIHYLERQVIKTAWDAVMDGKLTAYDVDSPNVKLTPEMVLGKFYFEVDIEYDTLDSYNIAHISTGIGCESDSCITSIFVLSNKTADFINLKYQQEVLAIAFGNQPVISGIILGNMPKFKVQADELLELLPVAIRAPFCAILSLRHSIGNLRYARSEMYPENFEEYLLEKETKTGKDNTHSDLLELSDSFTTGLGNFISVLPAAVLDVRMQAGNWEFLKPNIYRDPDLKSNFKNIESEYAMEYVVVSQAPGYDDFQEHYISSFSFNILDSLETFTNGIGVRLLKLIQTDARQKLVGDEIHRSVFMKLDWFVSSLSEEDKILFLGLIEYSKNTK